MNKDYERDLSHTHCFLNQKGHEEHLRCCICYAEKEQFASWEEEVYSILPILGTNLTDDSKMTQIKKVVERILTAEREKARWEGEEWCNNNHGNVLERAKKDGAEAERARIRGEVEKLRKTDIERNLVGAAISIEDQCNERFNTALLAVLKVLEDV